MAKNKSHTLAYSLIALQEMNLAFKYPVIYWNTACLISDSGGTERDDSELGEDKEKEDLWFVEAESIVEEFVEEEDEENDEDEEVAVKKKKKTRSANYGKIASAIGKMKSEGIEIVSPNINKSTYTFSPDAETNTIRFGLSGITRIGEDLIQNIIENRPYESVEDFLKKVKISKPQMINLIKAGAFDDFDERVFIMTKYIDSISDKKDTINLRNLQMLINFELIPEEFNFQVRVFNFNKYLKKFKNGTYYDLDAIAFRFYDDNFSLDNLVPAETESGFKILQTVWDKIYKKHQDILRPWVKKNEETLKNKVNEKLFNDVWNKYCEGTISKWEMDSISFYSHSHELEYIDEFEHNIDDFFELHNEPEVESFIKMKGKMIPLFKIHRIAGTVLDKDKAKKSVTILTRNGVVNVKIYGTVFSEYDKQISVKGADGKKHVIEKSIFHRGNKIIVSGIKQGENEFLAKKYKKTPYPLIEWITQINDDGSFKHKSERKII